MLIILRKRCTTRVTVFKWKETGSERWTTVNLHGQGFFHNQNTVKTLHFIRLSSELTGLILLYGVRSLRRSMTTNEKSINLFRYCTGSLSLSLQKLVQRLDILNSL